VELLDSNERWGTKYDVRSFPAIEQTARSQEIRVANAPGRLPNFAGPSKACAFMAITLPHGKQEALQRQNRGRSIDVAAPDAESHFLQSV
jgi:hypothetical protein